MKPKSKELVRVFWHHAENSAVGWYRVIQPTRAITRNKLARVVNIEFVPGKPLSSLNTNDLDEIVRWADIVVFSRMDNPSSLAVVGAIKQTYHVPVLMELDDLPMELNDDSWAFSQYRSDNPMIGADAPYWARKQMEISDGIIVTNEYLKMRISRLVQHKMIHVMPNCVDTKLFKNKKEGKNIVIGWQGGSNHVRDLELVREPILQILKEFPNVRFQTFGYQPAWTIGVKGCQHRTWVRFDKYYKTLGSMGLSIGVAPLVDNAFNRCKSNLRWLEYSALKIPSVVSPIGPYQCVRNNITGYYAKDSREWYTALRTLIRSKCTRKRIAENAYATISRSYNPDKWAGYYTEIFSFYAAKFARSAKHYGIVPPKSVSTGESFKGRISGGVNNAPAPFPL